MGNSVIIADQSFQVYNNKENFEIKNDYFKMQQKKPMTAKFRKEKSGPGDYFNNYNRKSKKNKNK